MLAGIDDRKIKGLIETCEGKKHDKKACDEASISLPKESHCYYDSGFQGLKMKDVTIHAPKKKPRGAQLTEEEEVVIVYLQVNELLLNILMLE